MATMKKFGIYLILLIVFFIYVTIVSKLIVMQTYDDMDTNVAFLKDTKIEILEARSTSTNGYIKGIITNTTEKYISDTNIKIDCYGKTGTYLGCKYLTIENFRPNESKEFRANFEISEVKRCEISLTDEVGEDTESFENDLISKIRNPRFRFLKLLIMAMIIVK